MFYNLGFWRKKQINLSFTEYILTRRLGLRSFTIDKSFRIRSAYLDVQLPVPFIQLKSSVRSVPHDINVSDKDWKSMYNEITKITFYWRYFIAFCNLYFDVSYDLRDWAMIQEQQGNLAKILAVSPTVLWTRWY